MSRTTSFLICGPRQPNTILTKRRSHFAVVATKQKPARRVYPVFNPSTSPAKSIVKRL